MSTVSGIVTLCKQPYRALINVLYGSLQSVTIAGTVDIQFSFFLKMSTSMLETVKEYSVTCD